MLIIMELQCMDWEHEQVNAALIKTIRDVKKEHNIVFYADQRHISRINYVYPLNQNQVDAVPITLPSKKSDSEFTINFYYSCIKKIIENRNESISDIFIAATNEDVMCSVKSVVKEHPIHFHLIVHNRLERELLSNKKECRLKEIMNSITSPYIDYICYSPFYNQYLEGILSSHVLEKIKFMHHPAIKVATHKENDDSCIKIGAHACGLNENSLEFINCINQDEFLTKNIKLFALENSSKFKIRNIENVINFGENKKEIDAQLINCFIQNCDFILIPYDHNNYKITASGIFWDAMRNGVPVLTLGSPYFKYYEEYGVGVVKETSQELINYLTCYKKGKYDWSKYIDAILMKIEEENKRYLLALLEH